MRVDAGDMFVVWNPACRWWYDVGGPTGLSIRNLVGRLYRSLSPKNSFSSRKLTR